MTKKLEKNSKFAKLDTNGDGIVSDKEFSSFQNGQKISLDTESKNPITRI